MSHVNQSNLGEEVDLAEIESSLYRFWNQNETSQKASLMNFAIWSESKGALGRLSNIVARISSEHACRALVFACDFQAQAEQEAKARAWITAHCHRGNAGAQLCSEQLAFEFSGAVAEQVSSVALAHILSDLPFVLYVEGNISVSIQATGLLRYVDRLVVDSSSWEQPQQEWLRLQKMLNPFQEVVLHDLAWSRAHVLRTLLATCFDKVKLSELQGVEQRLEITYAKPHRATALALVAWITTVLQASYLQQDSEEFCLRFVGDYPVAVVLVEQEEVLGAVQKIAWSIDEKRAFVVERDQQHWSVNMVQESVTTFLQLVPTEVEDTVCLLDAQLARRGQNRLFEKCLPQLMQLK